LDSVQLSSRPDEFCWNLHASGAFSVDSLDKAILQADISKQEDFQNENTFKTKKKLDGIFIEGNPNQRHSC
jgi:hypothetical protein